ncbi:efflux RND transporter permease subunit [Klebsiella pneumoniae]|nr:efflux RND transporter permease subunit [Klebsiella pneumoniae]
MSLDAVRTAISDANVRKPQGALEDSAHRWQVQTNDELKTAADYQPLIVHYQNGAAVRLGMSPPSRIRCRTCATPG